MLRGTGSDSTCHGSEWQGTYLKRALTKLDLPRPDSPTTMAVNEKPFRTDLRWTWFGRFEKPTKPLMRFFATEGAA